MQVGEKKIFAKSGNEVRLIEQCTQSQEPQWVVERTQGLSEGKRMICLERSLIDRALLESD